jgi:hypothetical protein
LKTAREKHQATYKDKLNRVADFFLGTVVHACNPRYMEAEIGRIMAQEQPRQKFSETLSQQMS